MITHQDLKRAADDGVITSDTVDALIAYFQKGAPHRPPLLAAAMSGEEPLRFIRNFHDVFLAMGLGILAAGIAVTGAVFLTEQASDINFQSDNPLALLGAVAREATHMLWLAAGVAGLSAGLMWLLGEYFAGRKRLFLPAIVICLSFAGFVAFAALAAYAALFFWDAPEVYNSVRTGRDLPWDLRLLPAMIAASTLAPIVAYYIRFKLPFAMGLIGAVSALLVVALLSAIAPIAIRDNLDWVLLLAGVFIFLLGVGFDVRDPSRATRFSDNGFWLHLAAAPLILYGAKAVLFGFEGMFGVTRETAPVVLITVFVFALVSLLINRRALIVSGMLTAGIAIGVLLSQAGLGSGGVAAATLLTLGALVVLLGAGWHGLRALVIAPLPKTGMVARIFPPETVDG